MSCRKRVLIADDHKLVAELCQTLLETEFNVVGVVADGLALVRAAEKLKPDVIVLDIAMPMLNGFDAGRQVKHALPTVKLVYLTMNPEPELAAEAHRCGASGYLLKTCAAGDLVNMVREALDGRSYDSKILTRSFVRRTAKRFVNPDDLLSMRQREVLQLVAEGNGMKKIGDLLHIGLRTVKFHKYRIREILGAKSDADLVKYAVRNNIVGA